MGESTSRGISAENAAGYVDEHLDISIRCTPSVIWHTQDSCMVSTERVSSSIQDALSNVSIAWGFEVTRRLQWGEVSLRSKLREAQKLINWAPWSHNIDWDRWTLSRGRRDSIQRSHHNPPRNRTLHRPFKNRTLESVRTLECLLPSPYNYGAGGSLTKQIGCQTAPRSNPFPNFTLIIEFPNRNDSNSTHTQKSNLESAIMG